jgi:acyl carrier protein
LAVRWRRHCNLPKACNNVRGMSPELQLQTLETVFREVFDEADFRFTPALRREDLADWDSLGHIRLVSGVEAAFDVSFTIDEIESLTSVESFVVLLGSHTA